MIRCSGDFYDFGTKPELRYFGFLIKVLGFEMFPEESQDSLAEIKVRVCIHV